MVTWETANTLNLGISSTFLNNKFSLDIDWFQSRRRDILIRRNASIPSYSGLVLPDENLGKVNNSGIELVATYRDRKGDFEWSVTGNFTYAENKVKYMDEAVPQTGSVQPTILLMDLYFIMLWASIRLRSRWITLLT